MVEAISEIAKSLNEYGPALVVVAVLLVLNGFFVWRDFRRESRQQRQIDDLHEAHNAVVLPLLSECKEAIAGSKEVIAQNSRLIEGWLTHGRG
jgi:hypothetical protein